MFVVGMDLGEAIFRRSGQMQGNGGSEVGGGGGVGEDGFHPIKESLV